MIIICTLLEFILSFTPVSLDTALAKYYGICVKVDGHHKITGTSNIIIKAISV